MSTTPVRPDTVPSSAVWDVEETCFRAGSLDASLQKTGVWDAWYPSGQPYGGDAYEAGELHGLSWCARAAEASPFDETFAPGVARLERTYERGVMLRERCLDAAGDVVGQDGGPLPARPSGVPDDASWFAHQEIWVHGPIEHPSSRAEGRQRVWYVEGSCSPTSRGPVGSGTARHASTVTMTTSPSRPGSSVHAGPP